jgi:hypothetical protein
VLIAIGHVRLEPEPEDEPAQAVEEAAAAAGGVSFRNAGVVPMRDEAVPSVIRAAGDAAVRAYRGPVNTP